MEDPVYTERAQNMTEVSVHIGDEILLYQYEPHGGTSGYVSSTDDFASCAVHGMEEDKSMPPNLDFCRFFVYQQMNYNGVKESARNFPELREDVLHELLHDSNATDDDLTASLNTRKDSLFQSYQKEQPNKRSLSLSQKRLMRLSTAAVAATAFTNASRNRSQDLRGGVEDRVLLLKALKAKVQKQKLASLLEFRRLVEGKETIMFGDVVQFRHQVTGKFLTVAPTATPDLDASSSKVELWEHGSVDSCFRVLPGFKAKSHGEVVKYGDSILFQSISIPDLHFHVSLAQRKGQQMLRTRAPADSKDDNFFWEQKIADSSYVQYAAELNASHMASHFKMHPFAQDTALQAIKEYDSLLISNLDASQDLVGHVDEHTAFLHGGKVIQIHHRESASYLMCEPGEGGKLHVHFRPDFNTSSAGLSSSSESQVSTWQCKNTNSFWKVESVTPLWSGEHLTWTKRYRIKHIATNKFLRTQRAHPWTMVRNAMARGALGSKLMMRVLAMGARTPMRELEVSSEYNDNSLWQLRPFRSWREERWSDGQPMSFSSGVLLYLENIATGQFLSQSFQEVPTSEAQSRSPGPGPEDAQNAAAAEETLSGGAADGPAPSPGFSHGPRAVIYKAQAILSKLESNAMSVHAVRNKELQTLWPVVHARRCLEHFFQEVCAAPPVELPRDDSEAWSAALAASELGTIVARYVGSQIKVFSMLLLQLAPDSKSANVLEREGRTNRAMQDCMREQCYLDVLMAIFKELFLTRGISLQSNGIQLAELDFGMRNLISWCEHAHRIVGQVCKDNLPNKIHMSRHTPMLQLHLSSVLGSRSSLMEIYADNLQLVKSISDDNLACFLNLLLVNRKASFVSFLIICAVCGKKPMVHNQNRIIQFLNANKDVMPAVEVEDSGAVTINDIRSGVSCNCSAVPSKRIDMLLLANDTPDEEEALLCYYLQMLKLYGSLCEGHNYNGKRVLVDSMDQIGTSYPALLAISRRTALPAVIRSRAVNLLNVLYVLLRDDASPPLLKNTRCCWALAAAMGGVPAPSSPKPAHPPNDKLTKSHTFSSRAVAAVSRHANIINTTWSTQQASGAGHAGHFADLKEFISEYVSEKASFNISQPSENRLTIAVLRVALCLLRAGHYTQWLDAPQSAGNRFYDCAQLSFEDFKPGSNSLGSTQAQQAGGHRPATTSPPLIPLGEIYEDLFVVSPDPNSPRPGPLPNTLLACTEAPDAKQAASAASAVAESKTNKHHWVDNANLLPKSNGHFFAQGKTDGLHTRETSRNRTPSPGPGSPTSRATHSAARLASSEHNLRELQGLVKPLLELLDGRTDVDSAQKERLTNAERFQHSDNSAIVMEGKVAICDLLTAMFTLRLDKRTHLVQQTMEDMFISQHAAALKGIASSAFSSKEAMAKLSASRVVWTQEQIEALRSKLFEDDMLSDLVALQGKSSLQAPNYFVCILLDLLRYRHPPLVLKAFTLMHQHLIQRVSLVQHLHQLQLVMDPDLMAMHDMLLKNLAQLQHCRHVCAGTGLGSAHSWKVLWEARGVLTRLLMLCTTGYQEQSDRNAEVEASFVTWATSPTADPVHLTLGGGPGAAHGRLAMVPVSGLAGRIGTFQTMVGNSGLVEEVVALLRLPSPPDPNAENLSLHQDFMLLCHRFLAAACVAPAHLGNQQVLWSHAGALQEHLGVSGMDAPTTLAAFFETAEGLIRRPEGNVIAACAGYIGGFGQQARWIRLMTSLVLVDGGMIVEKQEQVLTLLLERRDSLCLLWNTTEGFLERARLLAAHEHLDRSRQHTSRLAYHAALINLIALCASNCNSFLRNALRSLFSFQDCVQHVLDCTCGEEGLAGGDRRGAVEHPGAPVPARVLVQTPFLRLFTALYLTTDDGRAMVEEAMGYRIWSCVNPTAAAKSPGQEGFPSGIRRPWLRIPHAGTVLMQVFAQDIKAAATNQAMRPYVLGAVCPCLVAYLERVQEIIEPQIDEDSDCDVTVATQEELMESLRELHDALQDYGSHEGLYLRETLENILELFDDDAISPRVTEGDPDVPHITQVEAPMPKSLWQRATGISKKVPVPGDMLRFNSSDSLDDPAHREHVPESAKSLWQKLSLGRDPAEVLPFSSSDSLDDHDADNAQKMVVDVFDETWKALLDDLMKACGIVGQKEMLGKGIWNLARVLSEFGGVGEQSWDRSADPAQAKPVKVGERLEQLLSWANLGGLEIQSERPKASRTPRVKQGSIYELQAMRMLHSMNLVVEEDALTCIVRMVQDSAVAIPDAVLVAAMQLMRCSIYAEEPALLPGDLKGEPCRRKNFRNFVIGQPPTKFANSSFVSNHLLQWVQLRHMVAGVGQVAVQCISSGSEEVATMARRLLIALLEGGNRPVLDMLHSQLVRTDPFSKQLAEGFFDSLGTALKGTHMLIRTYQRVLVRTVESSTEITARLRRRMSAGTPAMVTAMRTSVYNAEGPRRRKKTVKSGMEDRQDTLGQLAEKIGAKVKAASELLRLLQLLTEGHHQKMQSLVRSQTQFAVSQDLVGQCISLAEELAPLVADHIDAGFHHLPMLLVQCVHTLTEFVQGPCVENQEQLLHSSLVKTLDHMIRSMRLEDYIDPESSSVKNGRRRVKNQKSDSSKSERPAFFREVAPKLDPATTDLWAINISSGAMCSCLHTSVLTLLRSMLEGQARHATTSVLQKLYVQGFHSKGLMLSVFLERLRGNTVVHKGLSDLGLSDPHAGLRQLIDWQDNWPELRKVGRDLTSSYAPVDTILRSEGGGENESEAVCSMLQDECYGHLSLLAVLEQQSGRRMESMFHTSTRETFNNLKRIQQVVGSVEIVFKDKVSKAFFPIPAQCTHHQTDRTHMAGFQKRLLALPRKSPQGKVNAFVQLAQVTAFSIKHNSLLRNNRHTAWLVQNQELILNTPFYTSTIICTLLTVYNTTDAPDSSYYISGWLDMVIFALGIFHLSATVLNLVRYIKVEVPMLLFKRKRRSLSVEQQLSKPKENVLAYSSEDMSVKLRKILDEDEAKSRAHNLRYLVKDFYLYWLTTSIMMSISSLCLSPFIYVLFLLVYSIESPMAMNIIQALRNVYPAFRSTLLLGILVVVIFAFGSFVFFYSDMERSYADAGCTFSSVDATTNECASDSVTLFQVVALHIQSAFLGIGLDPLFDPLSNSANWLWRVTPLYIQEDGHDHLRNLYTVIFSLIWQLVLLNIITGLITDAFMTIRMEEKEKHMDSAQRCLICSCDRSTLDELGNYSFDIHLERDHNPWMYACFFVHLSNTDESELDGIESYVCEQLQHGNSDFMPIMRCCALDKVRETTKAEDDKFDRLSKVIDEQVQQTLKNQDKRLQAMESRIEEFMKSMDGNFSFLRQHLLGKSESKPRGHSDSIAH
ncbi:hypothetical protein CYMTET_10314 [Cymbomonas tetramitiformis]|uniref:MIR domain-containing protein n=1 Tax=Cymbomonas tetramitiformis TaxID=36881 RepID=A0AAE0GPV6_9CHLO|nr:hypothetical protein CYMTET_10314 [Cymbomonas tetramitiformis]